MEVARAAESVREAIRVASDGLVGREVLAELLVLSAVASEHLVVIGPPGTAKSAVVRRLAQSLGGSYFEYLLGKFTEPSEIFGPVDLRRLREGFVETETSDMLPEADIAFLDEVFLGSTAILNTLLGVLNERMFRRGHTRRQCPLRLCVGAANGLPEDETLAAFADRFLVHVFVDPVPDYSLEDLLRGGRRLGTGPLPPVSSMADLDALGRAARSASMDAVVGPLASAVRILRREGINLPDRRIVKMQSLVSAAAALAGRPAPTECDLWPIVYAVPSRDEQQQARELLGSILSRSDNSALAAAAEDASSSAESRIRRYADHGRALLQTRPTDPAEREAWALKVEALGRALDAEFAPDRLGEEVREIRQMLMNSINQ